MLCPPAGNRYPERAIRDIDDIDGIDGTDGIDGMDDRAAAGAGGAGYPRTATCRRPVERVRLGDDQPDAREASRDTLVVEAPLELRINGEPLVVIMRTPGCDRELARGLLFAEGLIDRHESLDAMIEPDNVPTELRGNVLELGIPEPETRVARSLLSTSSCGVCGKTSVADLARPLAVSSAFVQVSARTISALPDRLRAAQSVFDATGGLHAAGVFAPGGVLLAVREDVGRHNAVDKLVGWALAEGRVPCAQSVLCVSGRLSFEIVQKAAAAGFAVLVAVSAPSSLAVDLAERYRITLCGFTRDRRFNIYSHPSRIT